VKIPLDEESTQARVLTPVGAVHVPNPLWLLKVPTSHATQTVPPPASPSKFGAHSQLPPPSADTEFVVQTVHVADPVTSLNVPASHATQSSPTPASPVYPAEHLQLLSAVLPSAETALVGQAVHSKALLAAW